MWAANGGRLDAVKVLLAAGADINAEDADGFTALLLATKSGEVEVEQVLQDAGAVRKDMPTAFKNLDEGVALLESGDLEAAVARFDTAIELKPDFSEAYLRRGVAYARMEDFDAALKDLNETIRLDPENFEAHFYRFVSHFRLGHYTAALQDCTVVYLSGFYGNIGFSEKCYSFLGALTIRDSDGTREPSPDDLLKDFDAAIQDDPDLAVAYLFRSFAHLNIDDMASAAQDMQDALRLDPILGSIMPDMWFYFRGESDPSAAVEELEAMLTFVDPNSVYVPFFNGLIAQLSPQR
jgi:tetratricopeptide (TPR) repeat protein